MDRPANLPDDPAQCHRLLMVAYKQSVHLEQQAADAKRQAVNAQQQVSELTRVLDETAASYEELRQEHTAVLEQLAWYKRWVHGRRRERIVEGEGQRRLFDLTPPEDGENSAVADSNEPRQEVAGHTRRLARSTLCDWASAAAKLLAPLHDLQRQLVLQSAVMWTDDTPVTVLVGGEEGSRQGRFWTYIANDHPYSVYDFTLSRSRDGPQSFLQGFRGHLHADAYTGCDAIFLGSDNEVVEVACWAHARRKFFDARKNYPREAHQVLEWIRQLYDIEDRAREPSVDARCQMRRAEANPVLDKLEVYLAQLARSVLPKSAFAKAVTYARNQWNALRRYTEDGRLTIDNNVSERTLRHQAIGRKNWLFLGSEPAGERAAVLYTILAGAKRHRIEPWAYVRELLLRLHADDPCLEEMLPDHWAAAHPEAVLTYRLEESRAKATAKRDRRRRRRVLIKSRSR